jgi:hypothetical protein
VTTAARSVRTSNVPQYEVVANPELTNAQFATSTGWSTTGEVAFENSAATLNETGSAQTRLNQAFMIGAHDRYLSFKLTDLFLDDVNNAPKGWPVWAYPHGHSPICRYQAQYLKIPAQCRGRFACPAYAINI